MGDWTRKGPLEPLPQRGGGRGGPDYTERRAPRDPALEGKSARDFTWERRGPLPPPAEDPAREGGRQRPAPEGMGERSESHRGSRRQAPAWGEGRSDGSRPPRKEYQERPERPERPERTPTAAEMDNKWRDSMRPAAPAASESPKGSTPASPEASAAAPAAPASRPKLNLAKRTVSEAPTDASPSGDSKASPFGAARPINTAAREKEIEEKRQQAIKEKREADEKAKEERRLAKEAAAKAEEEAKTAEGETPAAEKTEEPKAEGTEATEKQQNGAADQKVPIRNREPREPRGDAPKPRGLEGGNWRSEGRPRGGQAGGRGGRGGAPRGPRNDRDQRDNRNSRNGPAPSQQQAPATPTEPETPTQDEDGWTTVPNKKGRPGRPMA